MLILRPRPLGKRPKCDCGNVVMMKGNPRHSPRPVLTLGRPRSLAAPESISVAGCLPTAELPRCQIWRTRRNTATAHCRAWARYPAGASPISAYLGTRKICWINALLCFNSVSLLIMMPPISFDCAVTAGDVRRNGEGGFEYSNWVKMNKQPGACTVTVDFQLTWNTIDGSEWPQHSNRPDCRQIKVLHLQAIFQGSG